MAKIVPTANLDSEVLHNWSHISGKYGSGVMGKRLRQFSSDYSGFVILTELRREQLACVLRLETSCAGQKS